MSILCGVVGPKWLNRWGCSARLWHCGATLPRERRCGTTPLMPLHHDAIFGHCGANSLELQVL
ncbi:hypothetical protein PanWU01x14_057950 [Parasponia andersonii]|uniref:Uncharacterized protein n=1 Tax=Parasponia andersonii TaxID=3476 RepID=A0A2P5DK05_PARAD|nr:hypothetical protein PanWU01x14_057950 [Parasponia andersonii]